MRLLRRGLAWFFSISIALALAFLSYSFVSTRNPTSGVVHLPGLNGKVTINRDSYGVPHIVAETSDLDAYFALGYATAQDRLWQVEFQRRVVKGTLSQLFGSDLVEIDKYFRTLGLYNKARSSWPLLAPETRDAIKAYTDGINAFLNTGNLPLQFMLLQFKPDNWSVFDVLGAQKLISFSLSNIYDKQWENLNALQRMDLDALIQLRGIYPSEAVTTLSGNYPGNNVKSQNVSEPAHLSLKKISPPQAFLTTSSNSKSTLNLLKSGKGSNAWVVDGSKTLSGKPMLANDPHLDFNMPGVWYLAELKGPKLHVVGATTPGTPFVLIGHNQKAAWGITYASAEISTLKILSPDSPVKKVHELIEIKGEDPLDYSVTVSEAGPVINDFLQPKPKKDELIALSSSILSEADTTSDAFSQFAYASNWATFHQSSSLIVSPALNLLYADESGTIGYQLAGKIPLMHRDEEQAGAYLPMKMGDSKKPVSYIPFEELPSATNPASHMFVSANNKIVTDDYPYLLTRYWEVPPYRAERITQLLGQRSKDHLLTAEDMRAIQLDTVSLVWQTLKPLLLKSPITGKNNVQALDQLTMWDGDMTVSGIGGTIFSYWLNELRHELNETTRLTDWEMNPLAITQLIEKKSILCTDQKSCDLFLAGTFSKAISKIHHDLGSDLDQWQWGRVHHALFKEPALGEVFLLNYLWNRSVPAPGGDGTVNVGMSNPGTFTQTAGVSYRQIIDFGHLGDSIYITPTGQSDDLFSENRGNLMPLWLKGEYIQTMPSSPAKAVLTLLPE